MAPSRSFNLIALFIASSAHLTDKFKRQRFWGPRSVFIAILLLTRAGRRSGYRSLLKTFAEDTAALLKWQRAPSLASLSRARRSLTVDTCRQLVRQLVDRLSAQTTKRHEHPSGRRIVAIDGTWLITPRTDETLRMLDRPRAGSWLRSHYPQARVVMAVDVMRRMPLEWVLLPKKTGERAGAEVLANALKAGDIAVMDRGFPARWLIDLMLQKGIDVVMRMTVSEANAWDVVHAFMKTGAKEGRVEITVGEGEKARVIPVRLIRRNFRPGRPRKDQKAQPLVVLTSLSAEDFPPEEIIPIYTARWGIETVLREIKCSFDIERFHARSLQGIEQEVAAIFAWIALGSAIQHLAEAGLEEGRRVYRNLCFEAASDIVTAWLEGQDPGPLIEREIVAVQRYHYLPKADQHFERKRKAPHGRFCNVGK